ncbi:MAG: cell division ATPase MinD [Candidatus Aenigmarchaeota archaeon]|nr:cell division ATPase MinD [Candidatus Aenigmarchaeota archaeon]
MSRVVGIISGKGGVGKTVVTANIGMALHEIGQDVTLVDADLTSSNLGLHLGLYSFHPCNMQKILRGEIRPEKAIYIHPSGLKLMPSSLAYESIDVDASKLRAIFNRMNGLVLVDSPPGIAREGLAVLQCCDDLIVVTNPEYPAITDALRVIEVARENNKNILGIVVNKVSRDKFHVHVSEIEAATELPVIAIIPEDKSVRRSIFSKMPVIHHKPYSVPAIEFRRLAAKLVGAPYIPPKFAAFKNLISRTKIVTHHNRSIASDMTTSENYNFSDMNQTIAQQTAAYNAPGVQMAAAPGIYDNTVQESQQFNGYQEVPCNSTQFMKPAFNKFTEAEDSLGISPKTEERRGPGRPKGSLKKKGPGRPKGSTKKKGPGRPKLAKRKKKK